jgi:hypothetical protein
MYAATVSYLLVSMHSAAVLVRRAGWSAAVESARRPSPPHTLTSKAASVLRYRVVLKFEIKEPVWGQRAVGIANHRLVSGTTMEVTISYRDAQGQLVYPYKYKMACRTMKTYPVQKVKGVVLHIIPIADFKVVK